MGLLMHRASVALTSVTGCSKIYLMLFADAEGFGHLHVHLGTLMPDFTDEVKGPRVFAFLGDDEAVWLPEAEQDDLALRLRSAPAVAKRCGRRESNPHAFRHRALNTACLPVPPLPHGCLILGGRFPGPGGEFATVSRCLGMAVRAQESQILDQAVVGIAVNVVNVQDQRAAQPHITRPTHGAQGLDARFDKCAPKQVRPGTPPLW